MRNRIKHIENEVQDFESEAWKEICKAIDILADEGAEEFSPRELIGDKYFLDLHTLPSSISKLKKVKRLYLYGSNLKRIPPEIGEMESLEYLDLYTSYELFWLPFEIIECKNLKESRISTKVLYGNYKNRKGFPKLNNNPITYESKLIKCSVCKKEIYPEQHDQLWISLKIGTDIVPLLVNLCSKHCEYSLPKPPEMYVPYPHKGGHDLKQPLTLMEMWDLDSNVRPMDYSGMININDQSSPIK